MRWDQPQLSERFVGHKSWGLRSSPWKGSCQWLTNHPGGKQTFGQSMGPKVLLWGKQRGETSEEPLGSRRASLERTFWVLRKEPSAPAYINRPLLSLMLANLFLHPLCYLLISIYKEREESQYLKTGFVNYEITLPLISESDMKQENMRN